MDVKGNHATLVSDGALAGSVTNLMDCLRTAVRKMGIPLRQRLPARSARLRIPPGSLCCI